MLVLIFYYDVLLLHYAFCQPYLCFLIFGQFVAQPVQGVYQACREEYGYAKHGDYEKVKNLLR
jgi:hypothetical protein